MDEKNDTAPHDCPTCGSPSYTGFTDIRCTNRACPHYDLDFWCEWVMTLHDTGDPSSSSYRDFCSSCHTPQFFPRYMDGNGTYHAFCKHCGRPNCWAADAFEEENTEPQSFDPQYCTTCYPWRCSCLDPVASD